MRVLFDGWSLVHHPITPASLHLLSILENQPGQIRPLLALPEPPPRWLDFPETKIIPTPNTPWGHLRWEQSYLPSLAKQLDIQLLHLAAPAAPAFPNLNIVFSPAGFGAGLVGWPGIQPASVTSDHILERLRTSLGLGGLERVAGILWPRDLPVPVLEGPIIPFSPVLPLNFSSLPSPFARKSLLDGDQLPDLPGDFILYQGPGGRQQLELLLQAWNWAAPAVGEYHPLLLVGLEEVDQQLVSELRKAMNFGDSLQVLSGVTPGMLPYLYQRSTAVFHPAPASPWCGPVRLALASGKPLVATEDSLTGAIAGPAAYLVKGNDARALGAALVTVVVEQELADSFSSAGRLRAQDWVNSGFSEQLLELYTSVCSAG